MSEPKTATITKDEKGWVIRLSTTPAGWPPARSTVSRAKLVMFLVSKGYVCTFENEKD
jgi:hypothetical protein